MPSLKSLQAENEALIIDKIVYALKLLCEQRVPRDYVDVLLSIKYQPNVVLIDMAHMVAVHGNHRKPGMFSPYENARDSANSSPVIRNPVS